MPLFALICRDRDGARQTRLDNREAHLDYIRQSGDRVVLGGPFVDNGAMIGSLLILDMPNRDAAQAWADADPYARSGMFETVTLDEWKKVFG